MISKNSEFSLGHRKKLLRAIDALRASQARDTTEISERRGGNLPVQHREAEFRQITVMFCDLVGSTQLSEKLDPEDLQKLIDAYRGECSTAIKRYGGEVARYFGDGVMAFFGWPRAHEDDAVRAVHAALEIVSGVPKISGPVTLACRVGVCSGPVVVGEIGNSAYALGRWMRWEKRPILPRVYRPLPLPTRYSFRNRQDVSYRQLSIYRTLDFRNSKA